MNSDYQEFRTRYIRGPVYMIILYAGLLTAFSVFIMYLLPVFWVIFTMIIPASLLPFVIILIKSYCVRFGTDFIETRNLFRTKRLYLNKIKKYGICIRGSLAGPTKQTSEQNMGQVNDDELLYHYIYLSTNEEFDLWDLRPMKHLKFPYRKELYRMVKEKMAGRCFVSATQTQKQTRYR